MSDQQTTTFISRIGGWFRKTSRSSDETTLNGENGTPPVLTGTIEPRSTFLRPWAKRDAAIENVQNGLAGLSNLMDSIRDNLEKQSVRQDELLQYLSHLPQALEQWPESNRVQGETLKAIHQQIEQQNTQQGKLGEILERISLADGEHGKVLEALGDNVQSLNQRDQAISENLNNVGSAMQSVSKNSQASAQILEQMRDNQSNRDGELERILHRQGTRFTTLLAVAIFLSIGAVVAVCIFGYMVLDHLK